MSYLQSWPKKLRYKATTFQRISRLWFTDKVHLDSCLCPECNLGPLQRELRLC